MMVARRTLGAGVRKPPREETAGGVARSGVRRYGDFGDGGLLPSCVERLFGERSRGDETCRPVATRQNRRRAAVIEQQDSYPGLRVGEPDHCRSRAVDTEVPHWTVAAD
jgi:hypothetical protein